MGKTERCTLCARRVVLKYISLDENIRYHSPRKENELPGQGRWRWVEESDGFIFCDCARDGSHFVEGREADVIELRPREEPHLTCECGEVWWHARIVVNKESGRCEGYSTPLRCVSCGRDAPQA